MGATPPTARHFDWHRGLEWAMTALSLVFVLLLIGQYTLNLSRTWERRINVAQFLIWAIFGIDFFVRLAIAPSRKEFLKHNWVSAVALALPMFRVLRVVQLLRVAPGVGTAGVIAGGRRSADTLRSVVGARPALYIGILSLFVIALASAGMYYLEHDAPNTNITTVGDAVWWTMATVTTVGAELYPVTVEGRVLAIFVMVYGLGFAGYVTGTFVAVLMGPSQTGGPPPSPPTTDQDAEALREEIGALRHQLEAGGAPPANGVVEPGATVPPPTAGTSSAAPRTPHG